MMTDRLSLLRDYFPTAVFTGKALVFISEDSRVELTEHMRAGLTETQTNSVIRVRLFYKDPHGTYEPGHYEDFEIPGLSDIAGEIEKFVQSAVGRNIREDN